MKKFLKTMLAVICGILVLNLLTFGLFFAIGSAGSSKAPVPANGILKMDLSKIVIAEQASETPSFSMDQRTTLGLRQVTAALAAAAEDPGVKCIYLKTDGASVGSAAVQEVRKALVDFRKSGKPVVAYLESPTSGAYYLASAADKVYFGSYQGGTPMFTGVSSQLIFLGDLLDMVGVNVQLIRHGKYKSAGEMYIRGNASPENLHQNQVLVDSMWESLVKEMAASRGLTVDDINSAIDNLCLCVPADFVQYGLADELVDRSALEQKLAVLEGVDSYEDVTMIPFAGYAQKQDKNNYRASKKLAIIYANGEIVDGYDVTKVDGDRFASIIEGVRKDTTVKAVLLRVNSPGGSVVASEKIKNELDLLAKEKTLVASYGDYAASGGYWISNNAEKIFCDEATLTGSIGVFGMVPDVSRLLKETVHVGMETVSSNAHGDMFSMTRPFTEEEMEYMQRSIEAIYTKFITIVADGRDMTPEAVDEIAQGRVWAGSDALEIGLVDEIGTLNDALGYLAVAAGDAELANWNVVEYPKAQSLSEQITAMITGLGDNDFSVYTKWLENWKNGKCEYAFASMPYRIVIR